MLKFSHFLTLFLVISLPVFEARRVGGSGGRGLGNSGSRGQSASGFSQHGRFNNPNQNQGGFKGPHPNQGRFNNPHQNQGFGGYQGGHPPRPGTFSGGSGPGSRSSGTALKSALAGGLAGALIGGLGTAAVMHALSSPVNHEGRNYYLDQQFYQNKKNEFMCSAPLNSLITLPSADSSVPSTTTTTIAPVDVNNKTITELSSNPNQVLSQVSQVSLPDGKTPKTVVWGCKIDAEVCCGSSCCPNLQRQSNDGFSPMSHGGGGSAVVLSIFLIILLICCCCCLMAFKYFRSAFDCILPNTANYPNNQNNYYDDSYKYGSNNTNHYNQGVPYNQQQQQQNYPMQPYPQQQQQYPDFPPQQTPFYPAYSTVKY